MARFQVYKWAVRIISTLTALWLNALGSVTALNCVLASREGRQPHGDTYIVQEILSDRLCVLRFVSFWGIKPTWPDGLRPPVTQSGHCGTAAHSGVLV